MQRYEFQKFGFQARFQGLFRSRNELNSNWIWSIRDEDYINWGLLKELYYLYMTNILVSSFLFSLGFTNGLAEANWGNKSVTDKHFPAKRHQRQRFNYIIGWRRQQLCKFIGTKESFYIRKEFNSHRVGLVHQNGRRFIVLVHQYGRRDVMWKRSIFSCGSATRPMNSSEAAGDFVLIQSSLLFLCKCTLVSITTTQFTW